ncbi:MAG: SUMF1/EgtB/PvdO family nonheme iron enzyme [Dysgonamonadaceae bacterium]|jgi:formylglycine-generating enzyme required for sulfatase activity/nitrate/TMAO reductase-like tetraheme cytochrome c subunit|nr:SUMF1/EgtB/PvdO family nonheme iron enzyme [Dysgonamonadaceae bacterium]
MVLYQKKQSRSSSKNNGSGKKHVFLIILGLATGIVLSLSLYQSSVYFSSDHSCTICHVHPHVVDQWKLSTHVNNESGTRVHCVACHLPPQHDTWAYYTAKLKLGVHDLWNYLLKDSADFDWESKSQLEYAVKFIPNESCKECHTNLFPPHITDDGITAHLYYEENEKKLDLQCISCHLDVGHHNPNYQHAKMSGIPGQASRTIDTSAYFKAPTEVVAFADFTEHIPGTMDSISMKAIPGGAFRMGSTDKEPFHQPDEAPVHTVTLDPFFMAEVEVTWDQYWAFYSETMSEGRTAPEMIYENNSRPDVDAVSGPTPPYGFPDQGWGGGTRPAITMTHYAAETFCLWLSKKTGKHYRLPTEAEWEYAARGGSETAYFFKGNPKDFSNEGFFRSFFKAKTDSIADYVIYINNSKNRTQEPAMVAANPFGLKNMLGNVMEYCADKYDPKAYSIVEDGVANPLVTTGEEYVVRGGNYTSDAADVRCAARACTQHAAWLKTDPQQPKSIWWYSDIRGIGFRVVCDTSCIRLKD